jgi:hypothetical protein
MNVREGQSSSVQSSTTKIATAQATRQPTSTTTLRRVDGAPQAEAAGPGRWVLILDKDYREAAQVRNSLEAAGYDVSAWIAAEDAREALKLRRYELVVASTNVGAPLDALIGDLRPMRPPPKVILVTDEDEGDAAARCFLPTVVVVNRPFKIVEVADIADHLSGGR